MLIFFVVWLLRRALFLAAFAANKDLAVRLLFEPLLVETLRPDQQTNIVDARVLRNIKLFLDLVSVL